MADLPLSMAAHAMPAHEPAEARAASAHQPGLCNIGPDEIARRQRAGHAGLAAAAVLFAGLAAVHAPAPVRFLVALPAAVSASGYLQARSRFCVGFASRGVFNFGEVGPTTGIVDPAARAADRRKGLELGLVSGAIGAAVGVAAFVLGR